MFSKKVVSIDIGTRNIKIVVGSYKNKVVNIQKSLIVSTPEGAYNDGNILDSEELKTTIKEVLKDNRVRGKNVTFTLGSSLAIIREVVLPYVDSKEIKTMIRFEIEEYLPGVFDEYVTQYRILEKFEEVETKKLRMLVSALPKGIVEAYMKLVKDLKLNPVSLDIHTNSLSKVFEIQSKNGEENYSLEETVAIIDIGHSYSNVNIISEGILRFNRKIHTGGKHITQNIANSYDLSLEEAEGKKIKHGNLELANNVLAHPTMINELIMKDVDYWIEELQKVFRFYTSRLTGNRIDKIILYGGSSRIEGLDKYIESRIYVPTCKLGSMKLAGNIEDCHGYMFLNSIGAIMRR